MSRNVVRMLTFPVSYDLISPAKECGCSSVGKSRAMEEPLLREVTYYDLFFYILTLAAE